MKNEIEKKINSENNISNDKLSTVSKKQELKHNKKNKETVTAKGPSFLYRKEKNKILWFSVSVCSQIGGVQDKTIRRAIKSQSVKYRVVNDRYSIEFKSLIIFLHSSTKLKNKFYQFGLGQYIKEWK